MGPEIRPDMRNKLLLADDSLTIQKVVELVLVHENFEIKAVNDGEQAMEALGSFAPDIVLADIEMPKLNGYQLCEKIKNTMATAHIPVILLAGAFEPFDEEYAKTVGADDFIIKPFESQELISKVKALLLSAEPPRAAAEAAQGEESYEDAEALTPEMQAALAEATQEAAAVQTETRWDEETPAAAEGTAAEQPPLEEADEEYEAKVALSGPAAGFEEALAEALTQEQPAEERPAAAKAAPAFEAPPIEVPSKDEITALLRELLEERISALLSGTVAPQMTAALKESVDHALPGIAAGIVDTVTKELVKDLSSYLRNEITAAVGRAVPEVAERIIKKEIERISASL